LPGRLEDKSAIVRKQALLLLTAMLGFNPFAPQLPEDKFVATLQEYKRKLQVANSLLFPHAIQYTPL
jgi:condensin complex subunit 1